jgi:hypothetical protein
MMYSSIASIATCYRLDVQGLNPSVAIFSAPVQPSPRAHLASPTMGAGSFLGVGGWGMTLAT